MSPFDFLPNKRRTALRIEPFLSAPSTPVPLPIEYRADLRLRGLGVVSVLPSPSAWGWSWGCCAAAVTDVKYSAEGRPYEALSAPSSGRAGRMGGERVRCVVTAPSMDPYSELTWFVESHTAVVCPSNPRMVTVNKAEKQKTGVVGRKERLGC
jgi:hypothetical protein